jgi:CheY-like chemotaxis protein
MSRHGAKQMTGRKSHVGSSLDCSILVVDDNQPVRLLLHKILERAGFRVLEASNGSEALALFQANPSQVELLLTDLNMPGRNGVELATEIRRERPNLPVVFISAEPGEFEAMSKPSGCVSMSKPFRIGELLDCVQVALHRAGPQKRLPAGCR